MRVLLIGLFVLPGCSDGGAGGCPDPAHGGFGDQVEGTPCSAELGVECFVVNQFSSCDSGFYRCVAGTWQQTRTLGATDGASCDGSPLEVCEVEGNDCSAEPTGQSCACGGDGAWHCACRCYGGGDCPSCPAEFFPGLDGIGCEPLGNTCDYDGHHCACVDDGAGHHRFQCP